MFLNDKNVIFVASIKTLFLALLSIALIIPAAPSVLAQDQPEITLKNATLSLYPEYDDALNLGVPSLLVMFEGEIISDGLPRISFPVPIDAQMYSAGSGPRSQYRVGAALDLYGTSNITGWKQVSFNPNSNYFVVEYYLPLQSGTDRTLNFDFRTLYPVSGMKVIVQEPGRASNFKVAPAGTSGPGPEGYKIHTYDVPSVSPEQPLLYDITYTKNDNRPTFGGGGGGSSNNSLILIVIGAIVVLGILFFLVPQFRGKPQPVTSRSQRRQAVKVSRKIPGNHKFCRYCGKPIQGTDRFCPSCGQPLD